MKQHAKPLPDPDEVAKVLAARAPKLRARLLGRLANAIGVLLMCTLVGTCVTLGSAIGQRIIQTRIAP